MTLRSRVGREPRQTSRREVPQDPARDYGRFLARYPAYGRTTSLDDLRAREYARLDDRGEIYLDYTGAGLYARSQVQQHLGLLATKVFGNPHSSNPTSQHSTLMAEQARAAVLRFFNADPADYVVVFTANASAALRLVGEAYPFEADSTYLLTYDNHNSVNGIREFAAARGAKVVYCPVVGPDLRIDADRLNTCLRAIDPSRAHLFAYPAQSNFSGVQHSLSWVTLARSFGWDVLLDAAAFVPTNRLDVGVVQPDFVALSFYKMFGYPTGVGALIARREKLSLLRRPWFAGGTITVASVEPNRHYLHDGAEGFEDGTINYLNLPAVQIGLNHLENVGRDLIHQRVACLTGWLLDELGSLRHPDGTPAMLIYGPRDCRDRGGTILCNFLAPDGAVIDYRAVENEANARRISLRTGCFCNPGAGEIALQITTSELDRALADDIPITLPQLMDALDRIIGGIRISVGLVTNFADVQAFVRFARDVSADVAAGTLRSGLTPECARHE